MRSEEEEFGEFMKGLIRSGIITRTNSGLKMPDELEEVHKPKGVDSIFIDSSNSQIFHISKKDFDELEDLIYFMEVITTDEDIVNTINKMKDILNKIA